MGWSIRAYLKTRSGEITRIPYARFERLWNYDPREALPEYASDYVCLAITYAETDQGEPLRIAAIDYLRLKLDPEGRLDREALRRMGRLSLDSVDWPFASLAERSPRVIEARHHFARRQRDAEFHWKPTEAQQRSILRSALRPRGSRR